jgi:hypothetical protein
MIYTASEARKLLYKLKRCTVPMCEQIALRKRKKPPKTASEHADLFDYWQCPKCKTNVAYPKE